MLIRSQDKKTFINLDMTCRFSVIKNSSIIITADGITMGEYSTKAKAMKVLDMIQEVYEESQLPVIISVLLFTDASAVDELKKELSNEKLKNRFVFQMPTDSEVEV